MVDNVSFEAGKGYTLGTIAADWHSNAIISLGTATFSGTSSTDMSGSYKLSISADGSLKMIPNKNFTANYASNIIQLATFYCV